MPKKVFSLQKWFKTGKEFWILFGLSFFIFLFNSMKLPIIDGDTFYYISHAKRMVVTSDLLNMSSLMSKPPLGLWFWALCYKILGVTLFSTQFWHAVFSFLLIWVTYKVAEKMFDIKTAFLSAMILLSSFQMFYMARTPMLDVSFSVFIGGFFYFAYLFLKKRKSRDLYLAAFMMGLSFLNKGLLGFVIPGLSVLTYMVWQKDMIFFKKKKEPSSAKASAGGDIALILLSGGIVFITVLPWIVPQLIAHGQKFLEYFWVENIVRFFKPIDGWTDKPRRDFYAYFLYLAVGFLPWSGFILSSWLKPIKEKWQGKKMEFIFLFCWIIPSFIMFSISGHWKIPRYIFPLFPAFAVMLGKYFADLLANRGSYLKKSLKWGVSLSFIFSIPLLIFTVAAHFVVFPEEMEVLRSFVFIFLGVLFLAVLVGNVLIMLKKNKEAFWSFFSISYLAYFIFLVMGMSVIPQLLPEKSFSEGAGPLIPDNVQVIAYRMPLRSVDFYINRDVKHIEDLNALRRNLKQKTYIIFASDKDVQKTVPYLGRASKVRYEKQKLKLIEVY